MPYFEDLPQARRYNTLRLLGHNYGSTTSLYAISLATDQRRPVFADITCQATLKSLLSDQTLVLFDLRAFCLMPNHLHLVTGVKNPTVDLSTIMGRFESYTTQLYWKRAREIVETRAITLPGSDFHQNGVRESRELITALTQWNATLRPEVVQLRNWPNVKPEHFLRKTVWQKKFFDHVIRNQDDLENELDYIVMNPVKEGFVKYPQFYPFTGVL